MKAFRSHWNKKIRPYIHNPNDRELAEYWWKAALEECKRQNKLHWNESEYLEQWIEQELRDESQPQRTQS
jgi:hypothetical protein